MHPFLATLAPTPRSRYHLRVIHVPLVIIVQQTVRHPLFVLLERTVLMEPLPSMNLYAPTALTIQMRGRHRCLTVLRVLLETIVAAMDCRVQAVIALRDGIAGVDLTPPHLM